MWLNDEDCSRVVEKSWSGSGIQNLLDFVKTVKTCGTSLMKWNKEIYGNLQVKIKNK